MEEALEYINKKKDDPKIPEHDKRNFIKEIERTGKDLKELKFEFGEINYPMFVGTRYEHDSTKVDNQGHPLPFYYKQC
jgi:hypothetical protein